MKIAVVEDEPKLSAVLCEYLHREGYECEVHTNGTEALQAFEQRMPDMILLDLMLPGTDGMNVCRQLRQYSAVPVIMLTARVEEIDRLLGLETGADDYMCKPYSPREVVARVKAVFRRTSGSLGNAQASLENGSITIDEYKASVTIGTNTCQLTAVELGLLKTMVDSPGRIFNRNQLMNRIYPDNRIVSDRTIDSHIKKLRQKLAMLDPVQECIQSVYGIGYKFEPVLASAST